MATHCSLGGLPVLDLPPWSLARDFGGPLASENQLAQPRRHLRSRHPLLNGASAFYALLADIFCTTKVARPWLSGARRLALTTVFTHRPMIYTQIEDQRAALEHWTTLRYSSASASQARIGWLEIGRCGPLVGRRACYPSLSLPKRR